MSSTPSKIDVPKTPKPPQPSSQDPAATLTEAELALSLARLQNLHISLRTLRTTIPRLIDPIFTKSATTPEAFFASFRSAALQANAEVRDFATLWQDGLTTKALERARQRRAEGKEEVFEGWSGEAGWLDKVDEEELRARLTQGADVVIVEEQEEELEGEDGAEERDAKEVLDTWREEHKDVEVTWLEEAGHIEVRLPPLGSLDFTVAKAVDGEWKATCKSGTKMARKIEKGLAGRKRRQNLGATLVTCLTLMSSLRKSMLILYRMWWLPTSM